MFFTQIYTPGLAHCSYVIGSQKECLVIDPSRDIDRYIKAADYYGLPITAVLETHLHADFVSGHMELSEKIDVPIIAPKAANCSFPHTGLENGEELRLDTLVIKLLETPGHTPESSLFLITDLERGKEPLLVFSGDTLLVGDVGRPDLFPDLKKELAEKLFDSLRKIERLADHVEVYPAHGMGSLCGRSLSAKLSTTMGIERRYNYAFHIQPKERFIKNILEGMPEAPDHFSRCSEINRLGPTLLSRLEEPKPLRVKDFYQRVEKGYSVIDARDYLSFAAAHIPGSFSLNLKGNFSTFAGWVIPPDLPYLLVLPEEKYLEEALTGLRRVGLDNTAGYLKGTMGDWINEGMKTDQVETFSIFQLQELLKSGDNLILDNRSWNEREKGYIEGTLHVSAPDVRHRWQEWNTDKPIYTLCNTSNRSMLAASLLKQKGFKRVINVTGGTTAWEAAGLPMKRLS